MKSLNKKIDDICEYSGSYFGKDFFLTWERTRKEIEVLTQLASILKTMYASGCSLRCFDSGSGVSIFKDNSTRTRFSFAFALNTLGLSVIDFDEKKSQISHGETMKETATMISFMTDIIGIRDDMYIGEGDKYQREMSSYIQESYDSNVLLKRPNIVNLQSDIDHPTQCLADLMKLEDYFGSLDELAGKKIAVTWAYSPSYGKPLSVPQGLIGLLSMFGADIHLAYPDGYNLSESVIDIAEKQSGISGGTFTIHNDMKEAFTNADIVYPKSWAPFNIMQQRTQLLKKKDAVGLEQLEKHCLSENAKHVDWECNSDLISKTKNGKALYMHCLPADISGISCEHGEVSSDVFDRYRNDTYQEASFKPFVIMSMILLMRMKNINDCINIILK